MSTFIALAQAAIGRVAARPAPAPSTPGQPPAKVQGPRTAPVVGVPLAWVTAFEAGMARYGWARVTDPDTEPVGRAFFDPDHALAATALAVIAEMVASGQVDPAQLASIAPPAVRITSELPPPSRRALEGGDR